VIPIERLTEADRKWMLTAEYGGTGGRTIESGMVVEEPDIEIGAGVSSKAISRRIATDTGGKRGPISTRTGPNPDPRAPNPDSRGPNPDPRFGGRREREGYGGSENDMPNMNNQGVPPAVPPYGFNFASMPMLPPGFMMGGGQGGMPGSQPPGSQGN
jgi:protein NRD1